MPAKSKKAKPAVPKWADEAPGYQPPVAPKLDAAFEGFEGPPAEELRDVTNLELTLCALNAVNELYRRARVVPPEEPNPHSDVATDYFLRIAGYLTLRLDELAEHPRPALRELAQMMPLWPSLWCPNGRLVAPFYQNAVALEVGKNCQLNYSKSAKWQMDGAARERASRLVEYVYRLRHTVKAQLEVSPGATIKWTPETKAAWELPPLTKKTAKQWMDKVGWPLVLAETGEHPENDPVLRTLGTYRGTEPSLIRDAIKKSLLQALRSFAAE